MMAESAPLGKRPRSDAVGTSMMAMLPVVRPGIGGCVPCRQARVDQEASKKMTAFIGNM
jgi:hypothetical protein